MAPIEKVMHWIEDPRTLIKSNKSISFSKIYNKMKEREQNIRPRYLVIPHETYREDMYIQKDKRLVVRGSLIVILKFHQDNVNPRGTFK